MYAWEQKNQVSKCPVPFGNVIGGNYSCRNCTWSISKYLNFRSSKSGSVELPNWQMFLVYLCVLSLFQNVYFCLFYKKIGYNHKVSAHGDSTNYSPVPREPSTINKNTFVLKTDLLITSYF